jgi:hypothetical protein
MQKIITLTILFGDFQVKDVRFEILPLFNFTRVEIEHVLPTVVNATDCK